MKLLRFIIFLGCTSFFSTAQNHLVILSEDGEPFFLFVDGNKANDSAQSIVETGTIYDDTCRIKAVFKNRDLPDFSARVALEVKKKTVRKKDFTYSIAGEKGKKYLRFVSVNETLSDTLQRSVSPQKKIENIFRELEKQKAQQEKLNENYPPPGPCNKPVKDSLLKSEIKELKDEHIEINRVKETKWFISHSCLTTKQLADVLMLFDYEFDKVKIAEFFYDYSNEKEKFLDLLPTLKYSTEKELLKAFYLKKQNK